MEELTAFMHNYAAELQREKEWGSFDFEPVKRASRDFALTKMRQSENISELMLIYNMALYYSPEDPGGIYYMMRQICGPNPKVCVEMRVLGELLLEMSAATLLSSRFTQPKLS